jgi:hypothetical protein
MWDVAPGSSLAKLLRASERLAQSQGCDLSANMLAVARATADREGLTIE